ncbi:MAG: hypothetical protein ACYDH6_08640 [Acidimicrobiales bacterium]
MADPSIASMVIPAGAAVLGAAVPTAANLWTGRRTARDVARRERELLYAEYLNSFGLIIAGAQGAWGSSGPDFAVRMTERRTETMLLAARVRIVGSPEVAKAAWHLATMTNELIERHPSEEIWPPQARDEWSRSCDAFADAAKKEIA